VVAPLVVLRQPLGADHPGESLDRLVIRTHNVGKANDHQPAGEPTVRHVAPPRTSVATAEVCGALDGPDGRPRADLYPTLVARDSGRLSLDGTSTPAVPVQTAASFALPYLPDPLARGAAFRDLPATTSPTRTVLSGDRLVTRPLPGAEPRPGSATLIPYRSRGWPDVAPFRLVLADGDGPPVWDLQQAVLRVFLPKGATARTQLSSYLDPADLRRMGVWVWLREAVERGPYLDSHDVNGQAALDALVGLVSEFAVEGGLWQLTPGCGSSPRAGRLSWSMPSSSRWAGPSSRRSPPAGAWRHRGLPHRHDCDPRPVDWEAEPAGAVDR
jgi:hypothetical protein